MAGSEKNSKFIWCNNYKSSANKILDAVDGFLTDLTRARVAFTREDLSYTSHFYNNGHDNFNHTSPFLKLSLTKSVKKGLKNSEVKSRVYW